MARILLVVLAFALAVAVQQRANAKLPFFSLEMAPKDPTVGQRIVITMRCWDDPEHTRAWFSCLGGTGATTLAWVHPLDSEGELTRHDWIMVTGLEAPSGATVGSVTLAEPGPYLLTPLWRDWRRGGRGFPDAIRFEVVDRSPPTPIAAVAASVLLLGAAILARQRLKYRPGAPPTPLSRLARG